MTISVRGPAWVLVTTFFLGACAPAPPPAPAADTRAQDEAAIREAEGAASAAAGASDVEKLGAFYTDDTTLMPPNAAIISGRDQAKKFFTAMMTPDDFSLNWKPAKIEIARSGDIAYSIGTYHLMFTAADGNMIMDDGKYASVWKKQADGSWKMAVDIFNSSTPLPAPPAKKK
jgi:ketosteroid isomerase-like protein